MNLLRRHDRYVLKSFWSTLGAVLLFFTVIVVIVHLADRIGRIMRTAEGLRATGYNVWLLATEYYATLVPFVWLQILPLAAALAAAFSLSRLTRNNELAPLVTGGVSTSRVTLPIVLSGVLLAVGIFAVQELLVPSMSRRNMELSRLLNDREPDRITEVPHFDDPDGARLSMAAYQPLARRLEGALLTFREPDGTPKALRFYPLLEWHEKEHRWIAVEDGTLFPLGEDETGTVRIRLPAGEPAPLGADVRLLEVSVLKELALGLSLREMAELVRADPDNPRLHYMYAEGMTRCLAPLVLLLLSVPFCLVLGRRSAIPGITSVLSAAAAQYAASFLALRLTASGEINAVMMAWLPTVVLGSVGLALWLTMRS